MGWLVIVPVAGRTFDLGDGSGNCSKHRPYTQTLDPTGTASVR